MIRIQTVVLLSLRILQTVLRGRLMSVRDKLCITTQKVLRVHQEAMKNRQKRVRCVRIKPMVATTILSCAMGAKDFFEDRCTAKKPIFVDSRTIVRSKKNQEMRVDDVDLPNVLQLE